MSFGGGLLARAPILLSHEYVFTGERVTVAPNRRVHITTENHCISILAAAEADRFVRIASPSHSHCGRPPFASAALDEPANRFGGGLLAGEHQFRCCVSPVSVADFECKNLRLGDVVMRVSFQSDPQRMSYHLVVRARQIY